MSFRPLHDRVVVRRIEEDEKTAGGIIIPDSAKEKPSEGEIVSIGAGARDERGELVPMEVKAGDRVLFGKWSGTEIKINGEDLLIMRNPTSWAFWTKEKEQWLPRKLYFQLTPARACSRVSTFSPTL